MIINNSLTELLISHRHSHHTWLHTHRHSLHMHSWLLHCHLWHSGLMHTHWWLSLHHRLLALHLRHLLLGLLHLVRSCSRHDLSQLDDASTLFARQLTDLCQVLFQVHFVLLVCFLDHTHCVFKSCDLTLVMDQFLG